MCFEQDKSVIPSLISFVQRESGTQRTSHCEVWVAKSNHFCFRGVYAETSGRSSVGRKKAEIICTTMGKTVEGSSGISLLFLKDKK